MNYKYNLENNFATASVYTSSVECDLDSDIEREALVYDIASDYYYYEEPSDWPHGSKTFFVWEEDGKFIGEYSVEIDYSPTFIVWEK